MATATDYSIPIARILETAPDAALQGLSHAPWFPPPPPPPPVDGGGGQDGGQPGGGGILDGGGTGGGGILPGDVKVVGSVDYVAPATHF